MGKFKALSIGQKIIVIAGPVLLIIGFLPWYSVSVDLGPFGGTVSASSNAWQAPGSLWSILAIVLGLAMSAVIIIQNVGAEGTIPANLGGFSWPKIRLAGSGAAAVFILLKILNHSGEMALGFYVAILAVGAMAVGAFLDFQAERATPPAPPAA